MITEFEIEGFKSFGSPAEVIKLGRLNFLVGANASGKSNLISAFQFLQNAVMQDVQYAVNEFGGNAEVRNKILSQRDKTKKSEFRLKIDKSWDYQLILDLRSNENEPVIRLEILSPHDEQLISKRKFKLERDTKKIRFVDSNSGDETIKIPSQEAARLALDVGFYRMPCLTLREAIKRWQFFNVSPDIARQPYRELPDLKLEPSGKNLAPILHKIENDPEMKDTFEQNLDGIIPGFKGVKTSQEPFEGKWGFQVLEDKIRGGINPFAVSDGTIRLLVLVVIATWAAKNSPLILIEEPENGIHPHLFGYIVELFRNAAERYDTQFLITTHNPDFLDHLNPDEVILCDKIDGFTRTKRASDVEDIENFRKSFSLGELWIQGALGGIP